MFVSEKQRKLVMSLLGKKRPRVWVSRDLLSPEKEKGTSLFQKTGAPVRGTPISLDDPRIPDKVYHVTTAFQKILKSGKLRASGKGGLGGDERDRIVSFTTSPKIASQLKEDLRFAAGLARWSRKHKIPPYDSPARRQWGKKVLSMLQKRAKNEGWELPSDYADISYRTYSLGDWLTQYFVRRENHLKKPNPVIYRPEKLSRVRLSDIKILEVPKENLNTGAVITNFDLDSPSPYGLKEIRIYGDVPTHKAQVWESVEEHIMEESKRSYEEISKMIRDYARRKGISFQQAASELGQRGGRKAASLRKKQLLLSSLGKTRKKSQVLPPKPPKSQLEFSFPDLERKIWLKQYLDVVGQ